MCAMRLPGLVALALVAGLALTGTAGAAPAVSSPYGQVPGSPFATSGGAPLEVAFSPNGSLLASVDAGDAPEGIPASVAMFALYPGGALKQVPGSPFLSGLNTPSVAFSPAGDLFAAVDAGNTTVSTFTVSTAGALSPVPGSSAATGKAPGSVAFSPNGALLAVANYGDSTVSVFSASATGLLAPVPGSPFATGEEPASVAFSPNGALLATADLGDSTASVFSVTPAGSLTPAPGSPFTVGTVGTGAPATGPPLPLDPGLAASVAFSPSGTLLAVADQGDATTPAQGTLSIFSVSAVGALSPAPGPAPETALPAGTVTFSPHGLLAVAEWALIGTGVGPSGALELFSVSSAGALDPEPSGPVDLGHPDSESFSPNGFWLAVADFYDDSVSVLGATTMNTTPPAITGTAAAGHPLSCSTGAWTPTATSFAYQWERDGTRIVGATNATYTVQPLDEGTALSCFVTAGSAGAERAGAASNRVEVPIPHVAHCPAVTGTLAGSRLGPLKLGMTRAQARHALRHSSLRRTAHSDYFCLTPAGLDAGYRAGRVVWISTESAYYTVIATRVGAPFAGLRGQLRAGAGSWSFAPAGPATAIIETHSGVVETIAIAPRRLTRTSRAQRALIATFG